MKTTVLTMAGCLAVLCAALGAWLVRDYLAFRRRRMAWL